MKGPKVWFTLAALLVAAGYGVVSCGSNGNKVTNPPTGSLEINSGIVSAGQVYQHTFANAGSFPYHCTIHSPMTGTVTVDASSANDSMLVNIIGTGSGGFSPGAVTIKPGGHVRWLSALGQPNHTVTSH